MQLRRLLSAVVATAVVAPAAVLATTTAASAATATKIVSGTSGKGWIYASPYRTQPGVPKYGDTLNLSINVKTTSGARVYDGTLTVQRKLAGASSWTTVKRSSSAYMYDDIKAVGNATYRVLYSGGSDSTATYAPSAAAVKSKVQRKINDKISGRHKLTFHGKVVPNYKRSKVTIQWKKKKHGHWKKYKVVKTNKKSKFAARVGAPRRGYWYFRAVIPGGKKFVASTTGTWRTYKL
jgi:hypothetical protein